MFAPKLKAAITSVVKNLAGTGIDKNGNLVAWDVRQLHKGLRALEISPPWRKMIVDTCSTATFAVMTDNCIKYRANRPVSRPHDERMNETIYHTRIFITLRS